MWNGIILADEESNKEVCKLMGVELDDLYYPEGKNVDHINRKTLFNSMISHKSIECDDKKPEEMSENDL